MRTLLLALALLAPAAFAQPDVIEWTRMEIAPFPGLLAPLQGSLSTQVTTRASCLLADQSSGGEVHIEYALEATPAWAIASISPTSDSANVQECSEGYLAFDAVLTVAATEQAPAFAPEPIVVTASVGAPDRAPPARAGVDVSASYFALLDASAEETVVVIAPGSSHDFIVRLENFGNAATRVEASITDASEGLEVGLPPPVTLGSRQQGGNDVSAEVVFRASAPARTGFINRVEMFTVKLVGAYALDDAKGADESRLSFIVTVRSGGESGKALPLSPVGALLALALAATLVGPPRRPRRLSAAP